MKHVHHDMIVEWAKDTRRKVEVYSGYMDHWHTITSSPTWKPDCKYRFKPAEPKFITVNGCQVPEPVREPLNGQEYWLADPTCCVPVPITLVQRHWCYVGLVHLTKEAAQAHIDAMLLPSRSDK